MPYIKKKDRPRLNKWLSEMPRLTTPGELNYVVTKIILSYLSKFGTLNYAVLNEVMGVLACISQEFYRRSVSSYEDKKKYENGDVFHN
jgi:hypothetical protein